jgi:hypothetical protein
MKLQIDWDKVSESKEEVIDALSDVIRSLKS